MITNIKDNRKNFISKNLIKVVENKYLSPKFQSIIKVGDFIRILYKITEGNKDRLQNYEGLVIAIKNRGIGKNFLIRRNVGGIGIEQIFALNSPKIEKIVKKQSLKIRHSKLYYVRSLTGKKLKLQSI